MHEVLVNRLGGLSLPRKSVVRLTDRPDMTLDVYRGRKTTIQQYNDINKAFDRVWHVGLLHKLRAAGVSEEVLAWFQSYLSNRK